MSFAWPLLNRVAAVLAGVMLLAAQWGHAPWQHRHAGCCEGETQCAATPGGAVDDGSHAHGHSHHGHAHSHSHAAGTEAEEAAAQPLVTATPDEHCLWCEFLAHCVVPVDPPVLLCGEVLIAEQVSFADVRRTSACRVVAVARGPPAA